ncbi:hypothetical protein B0H11DRAFT_1909430 [Mycena galericulata]|nr:hypothetical protein B0H11DRAFT_1909430 [Mycena galericulata]
MMLLQVEFQMNQIRHYNFPHIVQNVVETPTESGADLPFRKRMNHRLQWMEVKVIRGVNKGSKGRVQDINVSRLHFYQLCQVAENQTSFGILSSTHRSVPVYILSVYIWIADIFGSHNQSRREPLTHSDGGTRREFVDNDILNPPSLDQSIDYVLQRPERVVSAQVAARLDERRKALDEPSIDTIRIDELPTAASEWPEVVRPPSLDLRSPLPIIDHVPKDIPLVTGPKSGTLPRSSSSMSLNEARTATNFGRPGGKPPGEWLLNPILRGKIFDVVVPNAADSHRGLYDNKSGTLEMPPADTKELTLKGRKNSVEVVISNVLATKRDFKLWTIYPQHTNEHDPLISSQNAVSILRVAGTRVLIIGPDIYGDESRLGLTGIVQSGGAVVVNSDLRSVINYPVIRIPLKTSRPLTFSSDRNPLA